jgi:hypothetical protein
MEPRERAAAGLRPMYASLFEWKAIPGILSGLAGGNIGVMMSTAIKALLIVWLLCTAIGLAVVCQQGSDERIAVSVATSPQGAQHEHRIVLKAAVNGSGLSQGAVKLSFAPTTPKNLVSFSGNYHSIKGYTDSHGIFVSTWAPSEPGEYMVFAAVSKDGCMDGKSVCFLRVPELRQGSTLADTPIPTTRSALVER